MRKPFVVISGLPGSGKTTLGRRLAPTLNLPLIDKNDILDPPLDIGQRIDVDTSQEPNLADVVRAIRGALNLLP